MFQYLFAIKKSGRQVPGEMGTGPVPFAVLVGADVAPGSSGLPVVEPAAMFSALDYFKFEAWLVVCPALEPWCRICAGCDDRGAVPDPGRPWPLVPVRRPHPRSALASAARSVTSRTGPCGAGGGHKARREGADGQCGRPAASQLMRPRSALPLSPTAQWSHGYLYSTAPS